MKVLLAALNSKFIHTNLAIKYLKEFVKDIEEVDTREYTINNNLDYIMKDICKVNYDLVLFSTYIWNVEDIVKLSQNIKKINKGIKIALGGPEVTYDSISAMKKYCFIDYILSGEGEMIFKNLLLYLNKEISIEDVKGLVYRYKENIVENEPVELIESLDIIPSPYKNIKEDEYKNKIVYYESSRGCPYNCQYCLSSAINGLRYFSIDRIKSDLKYLIHAKVRQVKFIDRTFNANKEIAIEIMKFLLLNDNGITTYHFEVTAHLIDDEMLDFLKNVKKGLFQFEIGVQSTNSKTLRAVGRKDDFDRLSYVVNTIKGYGNIHQHLDLIAGLPYEGYDSFRNSFNDVFKLKSDNLQLGFLKMIKGTGMRKDSKKYGYEYKGYSPYEVLYNKYISYAEIIKLKDIEEILEVYYNSGNFSLTIKYIIQNYFEENPFDFFELLSNYFNENGYFDKAQGKNQLYKILIDFYIDNIDENTDLFKELLKFDYLSLGKVSSLPSFFNKLKIDDFKNRCHLFLKDKNNLEKYLQEYKDLPAKNIIKYVHFEVFAYNVTDFIKKQQYNGKKVKSVVLFEYTKNIRISLPEF